MAATPKQIFSRPGKACHYRKTLKHTINALYLIDNLSNTKEIFTVVLIFHVG